MIRSLETLPGVDHTSACAILSEIGPDPSVFGNTHRLAAWAGLCPGNNESAGKRRTGRTRRGNQPLRATLVECAHGAARTNNCQFQAYHEALAKKRGYKRAIVATAHKLARCVFAVLRDRTPYRDPATDYEALLVQRNASRWLRKLHEFNILVRNDDGTRLRALAVSSLRQNRPGALRAPSHALSPTRLGARGHLGQPRRSSFVTRNVAIATPCCDALPSPQEGCTRRPSRP